MIAPAAKKDGRPILLFDDECEVCRTIARWVRSLARRPTGDATIIIQPIGSDPAALRALNPGLDIWDAYATVHVLMQDGSMKRGGEAVAEVLRQLPGTAWVAQCFGLELLGVWPFQKALDGAYMILADVRPLFGCESCGAPRLWVKPFGWVADQVRALFGGRGRPAPVPHFTARRAVARRV